MMTEDYVSLETAKLLKEKGFDEKCMSYYGHGEFQLGHPKYMKTNTDRDGVAFNGVPYDAYNAPTLQMAAKWLREKHKLHVEVRITNHSLSQMVNVIRYYWLVVNAETAEWKEESTLHHVDAFKTMEEAMEDGIKYVLENMIKDEKDEHD